MIELEENPSVHALQEQEQALASPRSRRSKREKRVMRALERSGEECVWCRRPLKLGDPELTLDHIIPRGSGGPGWVENELISCYKCNYRRGMTAAWRFLEKCEERGLECNREAIAGCLLSLDRALWQRQGYEKAQKRLLEQMRHLGLVNTIPYNPNRVPLYCR